MSLIESITPSESAEGIVTELHTDYLPTEDNMTDPTALPPILDDTTVTKKIPVRVHKRTSAPVPVAQSVGFGSLGQEVLVWA